MSFIAGMVVGAMILHSPTPAVPQDVGLPTMCLLANNFKEYDACRAPEIFDELHGSLHTQYCDIGQEHGDEPACDVHYRTGVEWRGILRSQGITPK